MSKETIKILCESKLNHGTTFTVVIPLYEYIETELFRKTRSLIL
jgi:signal transduction histidine kinase